MPGYIEAFCLPCLDSNLVLCGLHVRYLCRWASFCPIQKACYHTVLLLVIGSDPGPPVASTVQIS